MNASILADTETLEIQGARVHNLKNIDVILPRNRFVVITGLSGSGKSSLAFDTIYAEGQRRYLESFSAYARQFLGGMERPEVDKITGLCPVISIEQKTAGNNPRSTVGTVTELYDLLRLLFARASEAYSPVTNEKMIRLSDDQILALAKKDLKDKKTAILAPVVRGRKGHYRELFDQVLRQGYLRARIDGAITELRPRMQVDRYQTHDIEIVIDRLTVDKENIRRLSDSMNTAMKLGKGSMMILDEENGKIRHFSRKLMCPVSGVSYDEPAPNVFSFNSPYGSCPKCNGLGIIPDIDLKSIIPDPSVSIRMGGVAPLGPYRDTLVFRQVEAILKKNGYSVKDALADIPEEVINTLLYGSGEMVTVAAGSYSSGTEVTTFDGIATLVKKQYEDAHNGTLKNWAESFMEEKECPECLGTRLKKESLGFRIDGKNIAELAGMNILKLSSWFTGLEERLNARQLAIAHELLKEVRKRISFLLDVGLGYLTLNRSSRSLSGGESQRIRLATQVGSQLVGVLYILDEPSVGLHQRDNHRLIKSLLRLRDAGNSVIVVEHDKDTILAADHILDLGPGAGVHGGRVVAEGAPEDILSSGSVTAQYLSGKLSIPVPKERRKGSGKFLVLKGASGNNLKNVTVKIPLGKMTSVTGVSGSGKSTLINETLYPVLQKHFYRAGVKPLPYASLSGLDQIDKVIEIDQSPIGRTPRSNPATYTGLFTDIRNLYAQLPESKIRGYTPGRFSFNVKGGRCETCQGAGMRIIEMNFLPDVHVLCETCGGKRYNRETLEIRYRGKSISDVLSMSIEHAVEFFENLPQLQHRIKALNSVGLGYITLGQASTTLSGGEAQRVKLATELAKKDTGNTFYILDEPTTGLHFDDVRILMEVLQRLADRGNTIVIIEHNLDVIKASDYIIDMGPEGGEEGGTIVAEGTPEEVSENKKSITAGFLKKELLSSRK